MSLRLCLPLQGCISPEELAINRNVRNLRDEVAESPWNVSNEVFSAFGTLQINI